MTGGGRPRAAVEPAGIEPAWANARRGYSPRPVHRVGSLVVPAGFEPALGAALVATEGFEPTLGRF